MIRRNFSFLPPGGILIDVREREEYETFHLPGSLCIPVHQITEELSRILPDRTTPVFLYCDHGIKSRSAAIRLMDMGYQNVFDVGGIGK